MEAANATDAQTLAWAISGIFVGNALSVTIPLVIDQEKVPRGYLWPAARRSAFVLVCGSAVEMLVATIIVFFGTRKWVDPENGWITSLAGAGFGLLVGLYPYLGEKLYLLTLDSANTDHKVRQLFAASVGKYRHFRKSIQELIEDDDNAWQEGRAPWNFGAGHDKIGRRIRQVFAKRKLEIATARRDPKFMFLGPGVDPGQLFYPLVRHVGRIELQRLLSGPVQPPAPRHDWDGSERRRTKDKTVGDRKDRSTWPTRRSDDLDLIAEIRLGTACGEIPVAATKEQLVCHVAGLVSSPEYQGVPWKETKVQGIRWYPIHLSGETRDHSADSIVMIQMDPGCSYPEHKHLGDEDVLVLSGGYRDARGEYKVGHFVRNPAGSSHEPVALGDSKQPIGVGNERCTLFAIARGGTHDIKKAEERAQK